MNQQGLVDAVTEATGAKKAEATKAVAAVLVKTLCSAAGPPATLSSR